jgi:hypothetical protein
MAGLHAMGEEGPIRQTLPWMTLRGDERGGGSEPGAVAASTMWEFEALPGGNEIKSRQ